jgi:hypothetical protein
MVATLHEGLYLVFVYGQLVRYVARSTSFEKEIGQGEFSFEWNHCACSVA